MAIIKNSSKFEDDKYIVKSVNGSFADINGNIEISILDSEAINIKYNDTVTQIGADNMQKIIEILIEKYNQLNEKIITIETEVNGQATRLNSINTELSTEIGNSI